MKSTNLLLDHQRVLNWNIIDKSVWHHSDHPTTRPSALFMCWRRDVTSGGKVGNYREGKYECYLNYYLMCIRKNAIAVIILCWFLISLYNPNNYAYYNIIRKRTFSHKGHFRLLTEILRANLAVLATREPNDTNEGLSEKREMWWCYRDRDERGGT